MSSVSIGTGAGGIGTASLAVTATYSGGDFAAAVNIPLSTMTNAHSPHSSPQALDLVEGLNTIPVPARAGAMTIDLPNDNLETVTWHGSHSSDVGTPAAPGGIIVHPFANPPPANVYITAGDDIAGAKIYWT